MDASINYGIGPKTEENLTSNVGDNIQSSLLSSRRLLLPQVCTSLLYENPSKTSMNIYCQNTAEFINAS